MICHSLKIKSRYSRNVYFLLERNNTPPLIKLYTRNTILKNLDFDDELLTVVNVPAYDEDFIMETRMNPPLCETIVVNKVVCYTKKYLLTNKAIFNLFDRVNIKKGFLYDDEEMRRLIRIFCVCNSLEGLRWMLKSLLEGDDNKSSYVQITSPCEFMKSLERASTWHHTMLRQLLENRE